MRGYDSGKRVKGRKRHLLVDTMGLVLAVVVTAVPYCDWNVTVNWAADTTRLNMPPPSPVEVFLIKKTYVSAGALTAPTPP